MLQARLASQKEVSLNQIRVGVAGCGSVSEPYLEDLRHSPDAKIVSVCDAVPERAKARAEQFGAERWFVGAEEMLAGPGFDLFVNLTPMNEHYALNRKALEAGRHTLSEKPMALSLEEGRDLLDLAASKNVRFFASPNVVASPAFRCLAQIVASGEIGEVHAAIGRYGHSGPGWGPWFYRKGGGALFDLGVYNITTLTGLLGPARSVTALAGTALPEREVDGQIVRAEADDNVMLLMDHGNAVFSSVATGFVYRVQREERTIELIGTKGGVNMLGFDWEPKGVEVWTESSERWETRCEDQEGYRWQSGGSYVARCLATGEDSLMTAEHAFHVMEIMLAAHESSRTGRRVETGSRFPWPIVS
jgi:predicted dehydrogenase